MRLEDSSSADSALRIGWHTGIRGLFFFSVQLPQANDGDPLPYKTASGINCRAYSFVELKFVTLYNTRGESRTMDSSWVKRGAYMPRGVIQFRRAFLYCGVVRRGQRERA